MSGHFIMWLFMQVYTLHLHYTPQSPHLRGALLLKSDAELERIECPALPDYIDSLFRAKFLCPVSFCEGVREGRE